MTTSDRRAAASVVSGEDKVTHHNCIELTGELAGPAEERELPSGDHVSALRLTVRTSPPRRGVAAPAAGANRADSIDCTVWRSDLRTRVRSWRPGDLVAVTGCLRHRYWRGPQGLGSRYEVEVTAAKLVRRATPNP